MSRLLCLSSISVALAAGCSGGGVCGTAGALEFGLTASSAQVTLVFGDLMASVANDCSDPTAPGVISVTITGTQMAPESGIVTFCVPRPDNLETMALPLGTGVKVIDTTATDAGSGCTFVLDSTVSPTGTAAGHDMCDDGSDRSGFGLVFDGAIGLRRTCGATIDSITVDLSGTVAVTASSS